MMIQGLSFFYLNSATAYQNCLGLNQTYRCMTKDLGTYTDGLSVVRISSGKENVIESKVYTFIS